jgi:hypothetical protein
VKGEAQKSNRLTELTGIFYTVAFISRTVKLRELGYRKEGQVLKVRENPRLSLSTGEHAHDLKTDSESDQLAQLLVSSQDF